MNSRHITDLLINFKNKSIDRKQFDTNILIDIAFNFYYFKKESKKLIKLKENQNKIIQNYIKKESVLEKEEKRIINELKQKKESIEEAKTVMNQKKTELYNSLLQHKDISVYAENTYNTYLTPKNIALSLNFHLNDYKKYKKYPSISGADMTYKNPSLSNPKKDKITIPYCENPYIIDEYNDMLITNNKEEEKNKIIVNIKKENQKEIKNIINYDEDDILFYPEKLEKEQDIKKSAKWLNEITEDEIEGNFSNMIEYRKNNKTMDNNNYFYFDLNYYTSELDPGSIFDDIPEGGNRYKKFSQYLSDKSFKIYNKKMNYHYIDLMLLSYFDLQLEFQKYGVEQEQEKIALPFIKKMILRCGICSNKLFDHIIKGLSNKKLHFNFETYIECFTPIFEASEKFQTLKYKFLLSLVINQNNQTLSMENYKVFCNLIKGKWVYDDEIYKKISKNMIETFKQKYPKDYTDNFKYYKISSIVELLMDKEFSDL